MKKILLLITALMLIFSTVSCAKNDISENETTANINVSSSDDASVTDATYYDDFYKSEEKVYEVDNKYCSLTFPEKWKKNVEISTSESDTAYTVSFSAVFGSDVLPLYNVVFGESAEGYLLGTITTDEGEQKIYIEDKSFMYEGQLSEKKEVKYYDMCEALNDIISNLVYSEGLILAGK